MLETILSSISKTANAQSRSISAAGIVDRGKLMHMYADVLGKEIQIAASTHAEAKGSAIFASVAGGIF